MKLPEIEMVPLKKLKDNPWRDKKRNPINPDKVAQIAESIVSTGEFWIGVYGRKVANDFVELAFGHHRADAAKAVDTGDVIEAAKSAGLKEIPVAIREFTDGEMLMRMTRENLRGELPVVLEAVSAAVRALAEGKIEIPAPDPSTRKDAIRYAPSYVPGREPPVSTELTRPYTAATLANFLGGIYTAPGNRKGQVQAASSVVAALGILELEEKKIQGFSDRVYNGKSIREIIPMVSDIKQRTEIIQERRNKSAEEIAELNAQRLEAQAKAKAEEKKADDARKAFLKAEADAMRAENERKADKLKAERKAADETAKAKEVLNKLRMQQLDDQLAAKKAWEASQQVQDAYLPIRRDVEAMLGKLETIVSERNPFREQVKSLATRKGITAVDKQRLRVAAVAVADWYGGWVAPQFAPELKAAQKRAVDTRKAVQSRPKGKGGA